MRGGEPTFLRAEAEERPRCVLVGVGGAGCNAISVTDIDRFGVVLEDQRPHAAGVDVLRLRESELAMFRTTAPHLLTHDIPVMRRLLERLQDRELVFIFSGMGGETGTHAAPIVASAARRHARLVVSTVCTPFMVEGQDRQRNADEGLRRLNAMSHLTVVLSNDGLAKVAPYMQFQKAFNVMNQIMGFVPLELSKLLTLDVLKQVKDHFNGCREVRLGVGYGHGVCADSLAISDAFSSPWFDMPWDNVRSALALFAMSEPDERTLIGMAHEVQSRAPFSKVLYTARQDKELGQTVQAMVLLGF